MIEARLARLRDKLAAEGVDGMLVTSPVNRKYMSGFTGSSGVLLITASRALLITDFRYRTQAPLEADRYELVEHGQHMADTVREAAKEAGVRRLAFEDHEMTVSAHRGFAKALEGIELVPSGEWIERLRMIKDESELAVMREAAQLADRTFEHILGLLKPGMSERDVALEIEFFMRKNGATSSSFDTIVASGERSALPHGTASDRVLQSGEFLKFDFGAYYRGYCSDITRTVVLGKPEARHREIYDIVLQAQTAVLEQLRPGMTGKEADAIARDLIGNAGYGDRFGHGLGHGLGMEVHEAPRLSLSGNTVLEPGMVVTVEPGIYLPGFGGVRIEDDVVLTESGIEILTHAPKDFIVID